MRIVLLSLLSLVSCGGSAQFNRAQLAAMARECDAEVATACFAAAYVCSHSDPDRAAAFGCPPATALQERGERLLAKGGSKPPPPPPPQGAKEAVASFNKALGAGQVADSKEEDPKAVTDAYIAWAETPTPPLGDSIDIRKLTKTFALDPAPYANLAMPLLTRSSFERESMKTLSMSLGLSHPNDYDKFLNTLQNDLVRASKRFSEWVSKEPELAEKSSITIEEQTKLMMRWTQALNRQHQQVIEWRRKGVP